MPPSATDLTNAVKQALKLMEVVAKPLVEYAHELFDPDIRMSMRDIAEAFREAGWDGLGSYNTVTKYVRQLLGAMHRDLETRRAFLATAFREKIRTPDPVGDALRARKSIADLLQEVGMAAAFGRNLDLATDRFWGGMVEAWIAADVQLRANQRKMKLITPAFFTEICADASYEAYIETLGPPDDLSGDDLLAVVLWLDGPFRKLIKAKTDPDDTEPHQVTLCVLGTWMETLSPGSYRYSSPFAECLVGLEIRGNRDAGEDEDQDGGGTMEADFVRGVQRFSEVLAKIMLVEFSKRLDGESAIAALDAVSQAWRALPSDEKAELQDRLHGEPSVAIDAVARFVAGRMPLFRRHHPFVRPVRPRILRPYLEHLKSLEYAIEEVRDLARELEIDVGDLEEATKRVEDAVKMEVKRVIALAAELVDPDSEGTRARLARGEELITKAESGFSPGRVRPHLLFKYAAERSLLEDVLVRKGKQM